MFKPRAILTVLAVASLTGAAHAGIKIDFEGLGDRRSIGSAYEALGLSFSSNLRSIVDRDAGGSGRFDHAPSGITVLGWARPAEATINSARGLIEAVGFHYASRRSDTEVRVWSGQNATGELLGSVVLPRNTDRHHGTWDEIVIPFAGEAHSLQIVGKPGAKTYFDDMSLTVVPVPAAAALGAIGLALAGWLRRSAAYPASADQRMTHRSRP